MNPNSIVTGNLPPSIQHSAFSIFSGRILLLCLLLLYWGISLRHLTIVPRVYEDEPWQASTGWKLATDGIFGTDVFTGYYHMESRYYGYMPIHPLLLAGIFRLAGVGLFQARFEPVVMGLLTLALTFALGRRLYGEKIGGGAVLFLLFVRLNGLTPSQISGILFLDIPRITRYDMVVPVWGLTAVHLYLWARQHGTKWYGFSGFCVGLAGLSHLYGAFWLAPLGIWMVWGKARWQDMVALGVGFLLPWLPYLAYVLADIPDWIGQTQDYAPRFRLLDIRWYLENLWRERERYGPGLQPGWGLIRPGFWGTAVLLPFSLLLLARQVIRRADKQAQLLLVPAVVLPLLFGLFIYLKLANYLVTFMPILSLVVAWGGMQLWRWIARRENGRILQLLALFFVLTVLVEGAARMVALEKAATYTTPYPTFIEQIQTHIPPDSRVLGLHHYWLGMETFEYRSWFVPVLQNDERYWHPPIPIEQALTAVNPDVILWDERMQEWADATLETAEKVTQWMGEQGFVRVAVIEDPSYGRMEIFIIRR